MCTCVSVHSSVWNMILIMYTRRLARACSPRVLRLRVRIATSCWLLWRADLRRTFPNNMYFQEQRGVQLSAACPNALLSLHNVLCAFAANHPNTGYCQGTFTASYFTLLAYFISCLVAVH